MKRLSKTATWLLFGIICLTFFEVGCHSGYNPALYPSYDVLNPGPEVRLNPIKFTDDGNLVVNQAFILWVEELKQEVIKLRKELKK